MVTIDFSTSHALATPLPTPTPIKGDFDLQKDKVLNNTKIIIPCLI